MISTAGSKFWSNDVIQEMKFTYISLPIMLKIKPLKDFYVEAGPQFSYKIAEDISTNSLRGFINNLDLSACGGIGFNADSFGIYTRYMAGISKVGDFDADTRPNFKNGVFQAGFFF
ncbi:MAG: outer membrane beta-barrel protein [Chitinophagaceae bacterium]|nr:outer membrane beta-barrel protein [Chitinophagaceae bacterium]